MKRFLDIAAPSWLAEGNIPFVAETRGLSLRIITRDADVPAIKASPTFQRLGELAQVKFISMDDLQANASTYVTLTLVYQRGLLDAARQGGEQMAVLLNSDFILSEGSLKALCERLDAGAGAVLAPSLRAIEEEVTPVLEAARRSPVELSVSSRELVAIAFKMLHPTVLCARIDQGIVRSKGGHQYVWRPDSATIVARGFCLFPLAIRIQGPLPPAQGFCDYGLIPLLAPGETPAILDDSDGFFALELAPLRHEADFFLLEPPSVESVAKLVGQWSQAFHRQQALTPLFFRTGPPGPATAEAVGQSRAFVEQVLARLPDPQPVRDHPVWVTALAAWRTDRAERGVLQDPPELGGAPPTAPRPAPGPVRRWARVFLAGRPGHSRFWQPRWRLAQALKPGLEGARRQNLRVYIVGHSLFCEIYAVDPESDHDVPAEPISILIGVPARRPEKRRELASVAEAPLKAARSATLLVLADDVEPLDDDSLTATYSWIDGFMEIGRVQTLDLRIDHWARFAHGRLADHFSGAPAWRKAVLLATSGMALAVTSVCNVVWAAGLRRPRPKHVSAVIIEAAERAG